MSSVEPYDHADEQDASQECAGEFVVARCDGAIILQGAEEAFDKVALAIEGEIGLALLLPVDLGGDHRRDVPIFERRDQRVGIVALVCEQGTRIDPVEKRLSLRDIGSLPRRDRQRDGIAEGIDDGVDLGRQAAARAADGLVFAIFF